MRSSLKPLVGLEVKSHGKILRFGKIDIVNEKKMLKIGMCIGDCEIEYEDQKHEIDHIWVAINYRTSQHNISVGDTLNFDSKVLTYYKDQVEHFGLGYISNLNIVEKTYSKNNFCEFYLETRKKDKRPLSWEYIPVVGRYRFQNDFSFITLNQRLKLEKLFNKHVLNKDKRTDGNIKWFRSILCSLLIYSI